MVYAFKDLSRYPLEASACRYTVSFAKASAATVSVPCPDIFFAIRNGVLSGDGTSGAGEGGLTGELFFFVKVAFIVTEAAGITKESVYSSSLPAASVIVADVNSYPEAGIKLIGTTSRA